MKRLAFALLLLTACSKETPAIPEPTDTREPIEVLYVSAPQMPVREQANDTAGVIATYPIGEAVSVLAKQGEWVEVRTGDRSGWARVSELQSAKDKASGEENPQPKFQRMPLPVSAPSARGEIFIEASVNTDGDVTDTRILTNTTNNEALAKQNEQSLKSAKFYPMRIGGEVKTFKYYHRVTY
jgi:outer membrane biosynthesis protein TonB